MARLSTSEEDPRQGGFVAVQRSNPTAKTYSVKELVTDAWAGRIRVPHFQRDFRWNLEDVRRLFDSILKGYPIGSLLLWDRPAREGTVRLGSLSISGEATESGLWVVDGQQRVTSIANALHPEAGTSPEFGLAYDIRKREIVRPPAIERPAVIPLPILFDLHAILKWFARYPELSEELDAVTSLTTGLVQYQIPAYLVTEQDTKVLQDIFARMNNYGKRLTRAEVFAALNAPSEDEDGNSTGFAEIASRVDELTSFGVIDSNTVLSAVLSPRGAEIRRDVSHEFDRESDAERAAAYESGEKALLLAVRFLQETAGVPHVSLLSYRYLLVVLTRFFAFHADPDARDLQLLRRWYWRAAVAGPEQFKGGTPNAARVLCTHIYPKDRRRSIDELLVAVTGGRAQRLNISKFQTNNASTKALLCGWWARGPRSPETGDIFTISDLASQILDGKTARDAVRTLLSSDDVPVELRTGAANRVLIPSLEVDSTEVLNVFLTGMRTLAPDQRELVLKSHLIGDSDLDLLDSNDIRGFLESRRKSIDADLESFLQRMTESDFEDTPPLDSLVLDEDDLPEPDLEDEDGET